MVYKFLNLKKIDYVDKKLQYFEKPSAFTYAEYRISLTWSWVHMTSTKYFPVQRKPFSFSRYDWYVQGHLRLLPSLIFLGGAGRREGTKPVEEFTPLFIRPAALSVDTNKLTPLSVGGQEKLFVDGNHEKSRLFFSFEGEYVILCTLTEFHHQCKVLVSKYCTEQKSSSSFPHYKAEGKRWTVSVLSLQNWLLETVEHW